MFSQIRLYGKAIKNQIPMFEDLSSESSKLLYVLISSLLSFRRVNNRHLELNILKVCNVFLLLGNRDYGSVSSQSVREHRL